MNTKNKNLRKANLYESTKRTINRIATKLPFSYNQIVIPLFVFFVLFRFSLIAQNIGINSTGVAGNARAMLDIDQPGRGLLIPRMVKADRDTITSIPTSLLIYQTDNTPGFYYYNGTAWVPLLTNSTTNGGWALTGNSGTTVGTNFLGTTDAQDFALYTSNAERMRVASNGNVGIGTTVPAGLFHVKTAGTSFSATGGTITTNGGYTIHTFTSNGTFTPNGSGNVEVLVVAGGGSGGSSGGANSTVGAGGGAGGLVEAASHPVSAQAYTVTVGAGGVAGNGQNSVFDNLIAIGGGGGWSTAGGGGSGGGSDLNNGPGSCPGNPATQGNPGDGIGYGFNGGHGCGGSGGNGGGGGAGGPGANGTPTQAGAGGPGRSNSISGSAVIYAGGGGAGQSTWGAAAGSGGSGGGGNGGTSGSPVGIAGAANRGAGGGGAANWDPPSPYSAGGSGIVIIRYPTPTAAVNSIVVNSATGNVGIGQTNPTQRLHVEGNICYTGSIGACSDLRYKKDFSPLSNALSNVLKMNPVNYYWKKEEFPERDFSSGKQIGFIAQELEKIYPELVLTDKNGYKSVDYSRLTPVLVEAIKELKAANDALKLENNNLKTEVGNLKSDFGNRLKILEEILDMPAEVSTKMGKTEK